MHGTGKDEWGHPHSAVHMAAARLGCKSNMVSTRWTNSRSSRINRLRKHYSHLLGGSLLAGKAAWGFSGCLPTENADYCTLVNEWVWLSLRVRLICLKVHLGVWTSGLSKQKTRRFTARLAHIATPTHLFINHWFMSCKHKALKSAAPKGQFCGSASYTKADSERKETTIR